MIMLSQNRALSGILDPKHRVNELLLRSSINIDVKLLASSVNYNVFQEYTCERAKIFYDHYLKPMWDSYLE